MIEYYEQLRPEEKEAVSQAVQMCIRDSAYTKCKREVRTDM